MPATISRLSEARRAAVSAFVGFQPNRPPVSGPAPHHHVAEARQLSRRTLDRGLLRPANATSSHAIGGPLLVAPRAAAACQQVGTREEGVYEANDRIDTIYPSRGDRVVESDTRDRAEDDRPSDHRPHLAPLRHPGIFVTDVSRGAVSGSAAGLEVNEAGESQLEPLAGWLAARPDASAFQDPAWSAIVQRSYGHRTLYWSARRSGELEGVFSATRLSVPLLGTKYLAMPYQMHTGAPISSSAEVSVELVRACIEKARSDGAAYIEIRHFEPMPYLEPLGFESIDSGLVTTIIPLDGLALTQAAHGHRQRVRKAGRSGVEISQAQTLEEWKLFRRMYLETGRAMGAPQAGWSFFAGMRELMGDRCRLYMASHEGRTVGGFLVFGDQRGVFARCSAHSSREALSLNVGQALWWRAMTDAAEAGCPEFNCGITWTGDTGLIKWKEGWGGVSRPVFTSVLPLAGAAPSAGGYFEGYGLAKTVWKRLPLPVVDILGRAVTRWIG